MVALIRPDSWNFPLFLHVLGATVLVGAVAATVLAASRSRSSALLRRVAFRTLLLLAIPSWLLMRFAGEWIASKENIPGTPGWLNTGYIVGDGGAVILLVGTIVAWMATRKPARGWPVRTLTVLASLYLVALLVAMFAMSGKPGA